jgi:hypothetical protein
MNGGVTEPILDLRILASSWMGPSLYACYRLTHTLPSFYLYRTSSRKELSTWICEQHNLVNQKLGKPLYSCDMETLDERWRKSTKEECQK